MYKDEARVFWIEWDAGHVRVGRGDEAEAIMEVARDQKWDIKHMLVSTGFGSKGDWVFLEESGCRGVGVGELRERGDEVPEGKLHTPDQYRYQLFHNLETEAGHEKAGRVQFSVKAKNDAHVALGDSVDHDAGHWEIVLGGWGNSNSVIRD